MEPLAAMAAPAEWVCVPDAQSIEDGAIVRVSDSPPIALTRVKGELVAFADVCPHLGARLSVEGRLRRGRVVCQMHGRAYRLRRRGEGLQGAECALPQFALVALDGCVHVSTRPVHRSA